MPFIFMVFLLAAVTAHPQEAVPDTQNEKPDWIQFTEEQPETNPDWVSPGEPTSSVTEISDQAMLAIRGRAFTTDRELKIASLASLSNLHRAGHLTPTDEDAVSVLAFLATESYDYEVIRMGSTVNNFPLVRAQAVRLLGALGGPMATATLLRVLNNEQDPYVLSEAVSAIGAQSITASPDLLETLTSLTDRMNRSRQPDNGLAISILTAVDRLQSSGDPIDDPELFRAIVEVAQGGYSLTVRQSALNLVNRLRRKEQ